MAFSRILLCDDDALVTRSVRATLRDTYEFHACTNGDEALALLGRLPFAALILDLQMRSANEGLDYLPRLRATDPEMPILMFSGNSGFAAMREAMRRGAWDYIPKDFQPEELKITLEQALSRARLLRSRGQLDSEIAAIQRQHTLIGESEPMCRLRRQIAKVRDGPAAHVVIHGETGTGKEVVARSLRRAAPDGTFEPFVAVDASTIQSSTAESLLFGHVRGAFTGAERDKKGLFEEADGGIIYFDEIANMPLEIQAKLLRVIEEREILRLGSARPLPISFRVVCATNRDLEKMVTAGEFKSDLFERLHVIPLEIPPLRDRKGDLPQLIGHLVEKLGAARDRLRFHSDAMGALQAYAWPGNVRELSNTLSYLLTMHEGDEVFPADLPPRIQRALPATPKRGALYERVADFERQILADEFSRTQGNVGEMAQSLGIDRSNLYKKLKGFQIG